MGHPAGGAGVEQGLAKLDRFVLVLEGQGTGRAVEPVRQRRVEAKCLRVLLIGLVLPAGCVQAGGQAESGERLQGLELHCFLEVRLGLLRQTFQQQHEAEVRRESFVNPRKQEQPAKELLRFLQPAGFNQDQAQHEAIGRVGRASRSASASS